MTFKTKLSVHFIALLVIFMVLPTYFMCSRAIYLQKEDLRVKLLDLSKLASQLIDPDLHSRILPQKESSSSTEYKEIEAALIRIRDLDPIIDSVYTMVKTPTPNVWMFMVDSGDHRGRRAYCGEPYNVSSFTQMQYAFEAPNVDKELTVDKWGVWLSGYAPIYGKDGKAVAILGIDIAAKSIQRMQSLLYKGLLLICIIGIILSLVASRIVSRNLSSSLRELIAGVREVRLGNFNRKVTVRKDSEMQQLAGAFNKMTEGLQEAHAKLQSYYLDTIKSLSQALEAKDPYTRGHSERVKNYALTIARCVGVPEEEMPLLEDVCILHDIGKIGIPENILSKPGALSREEISIVSKHPDIGTAILRPIEFLAPVLYIVTGHHERPDGKGYPNGLKAEQIPLLTSIVSVADAFDAMTSDRPYRKAFSRKEAVAVLIENKDKQFYAKAVDAFVNFLKQEG